MNKQWDDGMVPSDPGNLVNGFIYESAVLDVPAKATLTVPHDVSWTSAAPSGKVLLFLEKQQSVVGSTGMDLFGMRRYMGAARRGRAGKITLASHGFWSCIHGGRSLRMQLVVPPEVSLVHRMRLSGELSQADPMLKELRNFILLPQAVQVSWKGWIHGPAWGWSTIPTIPDASFTCRQVYADIDGCRELFAELSCQQLLREGILCIKEALVRAGEKPADTALARELDDFWKSLTSLRIENQVLRRICNDCKRARETLQKGSYDRVFAWWADVTALLSEHGGAPTPQERVRKLSALRPSDERAQLSEQIRRCRYLVQSGPFSQMKKDEALLSHMDKVIELLGVLDPADGMLRAICDAGRHLRDTMATSVGTVVSGRNLFDWIDQVERLLR